MVRGLGIIAVSLVTALSSLPVWAGGYVIGNGGQGIEKNGVLTLRDLVEAGVEHNVFIGKDEDPLIMSRMGGLPIPQDQLPVSKDLLARKLSDLNSLYPNLGLFVLDAIKSYSWIAINTSLDFTPDPEHFLATKPQDLIQIANRLDSTIRVDRSKWLEMDQGNRVALVIHEALYSLLKETCNSENICSQQARAARAITGRLFSESMFTGKSQDEIHRIVALLDIPTGWIDSDKITNRYWLIYWLPPVESNYQASAITTELPLSDDSFMKLAEQACRNMESHMLKHPGNYQFRSVMTLPPYHKVFKSYQTKISDGQGGFKLGQQLRLSLVASDSTVKETKYSLLKSKESCKAVLFDLSRLASE